MIRLKRIYDSPNETDGFRILVDRLWPRGVKKVTAAIDCWARELAPSDDLRKKYHRDRDFGEFREAYLHELDTPEKVEAWRRILNKAAGKLITFLYASKERERNNAVVLKEWVEKQVKCDA
ncbi:hypothetical protein JIR001_25300 [Polycladomyces abyssicola]|uniref:DUF488 domain-containing protein n=1 Tax=Polycladomyces abyssicola TaxID=1125966 RepID=A0A8D5UJ18_9BACL|nr:DUF488 family protein [Polycladomyces abyssicola]BCU82747.1 hypothetical protein JIR001_25300 [Polycladomyces abyssicola]